MILRRLTDAVREQNWFTVVLEVAIVVVGIFIGLQVDDWNQERVTAERQELLLLELLEDLRSDLEQIDETLELATRRFSAAETLVNRVSDWHAPQDYPTGFGTRAPLMTPETVQPKNAQDALYFAQRYSRFDQERRTYDALLAAGDLTFVNRPHLGARLRSFYAFSQPWIETERERQVPSQRSLRQAFVRHGLSMFEDVDWDAVDTVVANDPALLGMLKDTVWETAVQHWYLQQIRDRTLALIGEIEETL